MSVDVVVIGAGGFGRETLDVIEAHNHAVETQHSEKPKLSVCGIVDDFPSQVNLERLRERRYQHLGTVDRVIEKCKPSGFVLAIGDPEVRDVIDTKFAQAGWHPITVIHPTAVLGSRSQVGEGTIICGGAQISTNTVLGRHVHVNPNATIGHDTVLEDFVSINPGAVISGEISVGHHALVGASAVVLERASIGASSTIGAGACVVKDVVAGSTVIGVPARPIPAYQERLFAPPGSTLSLVQDDERYS